MPDSRSLVIWALRFWFTGIGGGGTGDSRLLKAVCRSLREVSSSRRAREGWVEEIALEVGSMWRGRRVNVSASILNGVSRLCDDLKR